MAYYEAQHEQILKAFQDEFSINKQEALASLILKIKSPKRWTITYEIIMKEFISACIQLEKYNEIKAAMITYKFYTQSEYTESLETVLKFYRDLIDKKFNEKIQGLNIPQELNDVDTQEQPEAMIKYAVKGKSRSERDRNKAVLKMKLECYKTIIETVKANRKLEELMISTVEKLLKFLEQYNRTSELNKFVLSNSKTLQETISSAPEKLKKFANYVDLSQKETQSNWLDIRFNTYNLCKKFNLNHCTLKCMEDVKQLIQLRINKKDETKKRYISMYYENLAEIFWKSEYYNLHAFFFLQHFNFFIKYNAQSDEQEGQNKADKCVLSILSIPFNTVDTRFSGEKLFRIRDFILETSKYIPSGDEMVKLIINNNILDQCSQKVQEVFEILGTNKINIFSISKQLKTVLEGFSFDGFKQLIQQKVIFRVLTQLGSIYKTLKIERLTKFIDFSSESELISLLLEAGQTGQIRCQLDSQKNIITFGKIQKVESAAGTAFLFAEKCKRLLLSKQEETAVSARLNEEVQDCLKDAGSQVAARLKEIRKQKNKQKRQQNKELREQEIQEQKLEEMEKQRREREIARQVALEKARKLKIEEHLRIINKAIDEIVKIKDKQIAKIGGVKIEDLTEEDKLTLSAETLGELKTSIIEAQKNDVDDRAKKMFQKFDYISREQRIIEIGNVEKFQSKSQEEMQQIITISKQKFEENLEFKNKIQQTKQFKDKFFTKVMEMRQKKHAERMVQFQSHIEQYKESIQEKALIFFEEDKKQKELEEEERKKDEEIELEDKIQTQQQEEEINVWRNRNIVPEKIEIKPEDLLDDDEKKKKEDFGFRKGGATQPIVPQKEETNEFKKGAAVKNDDGFFKKGGAGPVQKAAVSSENQEGGFKKGAFARKEDTGFKRGGAGAKTQEAGGWGKGAGGIVRDQRFQKDEKKTTKEDDGWNTVRKNNTQQKKPEAKKNEDSWGLRRKKN